jgi:hypothetical protein
MALQAQAETARAGATIAHFYQRDAQRVVPPLSDAWPAFAVTDRRDPVRRLMALRVRPGVPPRARILDSVEEVSLPNLLMPLADGPGLDAGGQPGWFIICQAPPGPALDLAAGPWREQELIASILLPAAAALEALSERRLTHRAIRPDNLFRGGPGQPVTLGPFWAAPPGTGQPPVADPPFLAWCRTSCQGDGSIADDVYALGVTLLALSMGRWPLAGTDPQEVLHRCLVHGSFATLTAGAPNLSTYLLDLLRGMLAEDPDHRPSPALLLDPLRAAARRSTTRPPRRAQRQIDIGGRSAWTARELAFALASQPEPALALLRDGTVDRWVRRSLNDPSLAAKIEEHEPGTGPASGAMLMMRAVAAAEPLAPLVWRGMALWPDALGTALAAADSATASVLREIVEEDVVAHWAAGHTRRAEFAVLVQQSHEWSLWLRTRGASGGVNRLLYGLNPLLACASPLLAGRPVLRLSELLPALEAASAKADRKQPPIDAHIVAFIAARAAQALKAELTGLNGFVSEAERPLVLSLFSRLQTRLNTGPLPGLAAWLHESGFTGVGRWRSKVTRGALAKRVAALVAAGMLAALVNAVEDGAAFAADASAAKAASARIAALKRRLEESEVRAAARVVEAKRLAHDIAAGAGLLALLGATIKLAFR